jgi:sodium-dependent dicarboxylate transporter 2/3/5
MLPIATPPNAVVFSSGYLTAADMARVGWRLNVLGAIVITAVMTIMGMY